MIRSIVTFEDPRLRTPSREVSDVHDPHIQALIQDMMQTMDMADGVGIAAPQVGENIRICWISYKSHRFVVINPRLTVVDSRPQFDEEGCLSFPGIFGHVSRAKQVELSGLDINGQPIHMIAKNYLARVFQHEVDHLQGNVIVDKFVS